MNVQAWSNRVALPLVILFLAVGGYARADSRTIREAIFKAIDAKHGFGAYEIEIDASRGIVTLEGTVSSDEARQWVGEISEQQPGVQEVINKLEVKSASVASEANTQLARRVRDALIRAPVRDKYALRVRADEATVTISGEVKSESDRDTLEKTARLTPGVTEVVNELTVKENGNDAELARRVEAALMRDVPDLSQGVRVSVNNGVVTLSGEKRSHREIDHLLSIVLMVDGVRDIRSELVLHGAG